MLEVCADLNDSIPGVAQHLERASNGGQVAGENPSLRPAGLFNLYTLICHM